jgi:hypothetical protein
MQVSISLSSSGKAKHNLIMTAIIIGFTWMAGWSYPEVAIGCKITQ